LTELTRAVGRHGVVRQTQDLESLPEILDEFLDMGCRYWVVDGGDGTLHWLLSVGHRRARERGVEVPSIVPANGGSIDFVAHKVGIRGQAVEVIRALIDHLEGGRDPAIIELDTLHVVGEASREGGTAMDQVGFASAIGGVAQRFFDKLYQRDKPIDAWAIIDVLAKSSVGGVMSTAPRPIRHFIMPGLQRYADEIFEPTRARVDVDGKVLDFDSFASLQVGSIDISLGGVVRTFRHAADDGVLHAQALSTNRLGVVANLPNIVMGTPIRARKVFDGPVSKISVEALPGTQLDPVVDGEVFSGQSRIEVSQGPKLRVPAVCCG
jgi:hypothetical protein